MSDVPRPLAARTLFFANRTCCVCRDESRGVEVHHIDGNHNNHDPDNLAVLCRDCHNDATVSGGLLRKLDADQVTKYRDEWNVIAAQIRNKGIPTSREFVAIDEFLEYARRHGARTVGIKHLREAVKGSSPSYYAHFAVLTAQIGMETCSIKAHIGYEYPEREAFPADKEIGFVRNCVTDAGFSAFDGAVTTFMPEYLRATVS
jgi:hypothetical protein